LTDLRTGEGGTAGEHDGAFGFGSDEYPLALPADRRLARRNAMQQRQRQ
jgi:hypothetical protein